MPNYELYDYNVSGPSDDVDELIDKLKKVLQEATAKGWTRLYASTTTDGIDILGFPPPDPEKIRKAAERRRKQYERLKKEFESG